MTTGHSNFKPQPSMYMALCILIYRTLGSPGQAIRAPPVIAGSLRHVSISLQYAPSMAV